MLFWCCFSHQSTHVQAHQQSWPKDYMRQAGSLFINESARQNESARIQLTSCNSETNSAELTIDHRVGFKTMQNNDATNEPAHLLQSSPYLLLAAFVLVLSSV